MVDGKMEELESYYESVYNSMRGGLDNTIFDNEHMDAAYIFGYHAMRNYDCGHDPLTSVKIILDVAIMEGLKI